MARRPTSGPTDAELEILTVLWDRGPSTVREVNVAIEQLRPTGYTTTLKLMQIMTGKGLLVREKSIRPHCYRPASSKEKTQRQLVKNLLNRAFDGSAAQLVLRALSTENATPEELTKIRGVLDEIEGENR